MQKIPATVITGFLGAGKTTMIRNMLSNAGGRKIALIINEFGDLGVDRELLAGCGSATCREEDIVELTNGCICCTVADEFIPSIERLLALDPKPDHIVIETSGLALPKPLLKAFDWPDLRSRITIDGVEYDAEAAMVLVASARTPSNATGEAGAPLTRTATRALLSRVLWSARSMRSFAASSAAVKSSPSRFSAPLPTGGAAGRRVPLRGRGVRPEPPSQCRPPPRGAATRLTTRACCIAIWSPPATTTPCGSKVLWSSRCTPRRSGCGASCS